MPARNKMDMSGTRMDFTGNGVHALYGNTRNMYVVETNDGVMERLRNAYFHDFGTRQRYYLLDPTEPAWMERIKLDGTIETWYASPVGEDDEVEPTWVRLSLSEPARLSLFQNLTVTGDVSIEKTLSVEETIAAKKSITSDEDIIAKKQVKSQIAEGTAPLVITSKTKVTNLNVDQVDGYDASATPEAGKLLVMPEDNKIPAENLDLPAPVSDVDKVDGKDAADFLWKAPDYTGDWIAVSANSSYTVTHNLAAFPRIAIIQFRQAGTTDPSQILFPSCDRSVTYNTAIYFSNNNTVVILTGQTNVGIRANGANATSGEYRILLWK